MMYPLGLTAAQLAQYEASLTVSHSYRVVVELCSLIGDPVLDISRRVVDGQISADMSGDVTRTLSLTVTDPEHTLRIDADSLAAGAVYADRAVRVRWVTTTPFGEVTVPVFLGPVVSVEREGDTLSLNADGMETMARTPAWSAYSIAKGALKSTAIRDILSRTGETHFRLSTGTARLANALNVKSDTVPWDVAQQVARGMGWQLVYDGAGAAVLRPWPQSPSWVWRGGRGGALLSQFQVSYDFDAVRNAVRVVGATPKGSKVPVTATAVAPPSHALSPQRIGRAGKPRYLPEVIEDDSIATVADAKDTAQRKLAQLLGMGVEVSFDSLPIPHVELGDLAYAVADDGTTVTFRVRSFTLPLGVGGAPMTVGYMIRATARRV